MANTYSWKVANLERTVADGKVGVVHYTVNAVSDVVNPNSEEGGFYSAGAYGSVGLDGEVSVAFDDLTEEVVVGWVKEKLGGDEKVAEIEAALDAQIAEQQAPTKAAGLPW
jgi:aspartate oxidase